MNELVNGYIEDVVAKTDYMRESLLHMYWWMLASYWIRIKMAICG